MYYIEVEIDGELKKITDPLGNVETFNNQDDTWTRLYEVFSSEMVYVDGVLTHIKKIKGLSVQNVES